MNYNVEPGIVPANAGVAVASTQSSDSTPSSLHPTDEGSSNIQTAFVPVQATVPHHPSTPMLSAQSHTHISSPAKQARLHVLSQTTSPLGLPSSATKRAFDGVAPMCGTKFVRTPKRCRADEPGANADVLTSGIDAAALWHETVNSPSSPLRTLSEKSKKLPLTGYMPPKLISYFFLSTYVIQVRS